MDDRPSGYPPRVTDAPVKVILANDAPFIVEGLQAALAPYASRVEVVGTATGDPDLLLEATTSGADVLVLDTFHRADAGVDAAARSLAEKPGLELVIYTEVEDLHHLFAALRVGVRGYLLKQTDPEALVAALERVAAGETVIDQELATQAALLAAKSTANREWEGAHLGLSRREAQVLRLLASGKGLDEIAGALEVGRETIRTHVRQIYRKLGVNERGAAVAVAWREGMGS